MHETNSKIKTVMFDLGGVFLNRGIWAFWKYLSENYDVTFDQAKDCFLKHYKPYFSGSMSEKDFWRSFLTDAKIVADWSDLRTKLLNFFEINEGMATLCTNLREKGFKTALLSDQTKEWWPFLDDKYKISQFFDYVFISALIGLHKPDPKLFDYALKESGSEPSSTIFIDDLESNLGNAKNLGIDTILFENEKQLETELEKRSVN